MIIDLAYSGPLLGIASAAQEAEQQGFQALWSSETKHDPFLALSLAAQRTTHLRLGTGIAVALARNPYLLAQSAWDLALLSGDRFLLGLGSQVKAHITRRFSMPWDSPVEQMRETVQAIRAIWHSFETGEPLRFEGRHYRHTLLIPNFNPGPRQGAPIPIGLAAVGPQMTSLAGEVADFVILHPFTTKAFVQTTTLPALEKGCQKGGRARKELEVIGSLFAFAEGPEADATDEIVRQKVAFYGSTPAYRQVLAAQGRQELVEPLHALSKEGRWREMARLIDDDLLDHFRVRAPQNRLFEKIAERFQGVYDRVVVTVPGR